MPGGFLHVLMGLGEWSRSEPGAEPRLTLDQAPRSHAGHSKVMRNTQLAATSGKFGFNDFLRTQ